MKLNIAKDKRLAYFFGFAIIAHLIVFSQLDTPKKKYIIYPKNVMIVPAEYATLSDQTRNPKSLYTASYVDDQVSNSNGDFRILKEMPSFTDDINPEPHSKLAHQVSYKDSIAMNRKAIEESVPKDLQEDKDTENLIDKTNNIKESQDTSSDHETQKDSKDPRDSEQNGKQNTGETENANKIKVKEVNIDNMIASDLKKSFKTKKSSRTSKRESPDHADIKAPRTKNSNKSSTVLVKNTSNKGHRKTLLSKGSKEDLIAAHKNDELEINKYDDRVGETDPNDREKSNQPKVKQKHQKGMDKNNLIARSPKKKNRSRKRKKRYPDDYNHIRKSKWQRLRDAGKLSEINDDIRPLNIYKKGGWKDFTVDMSIQRNKAPELNIKSYDELRHKNYMRHIVRKVGLKWFYRYAPIRQVLNGYMKPGRPIVVGFSLTPKGRMRNFRFITRGTNKVQQQAVERTFRKMRFDPPPKGFKYRNLRVRFVITKPRYDKSRRVKIIWGKVYLSGQVKNLYDQ